MPHFESYSLIKWLHLVSIAMGGGSAMVVLVLAGLEDKPLIRRRAVIALAAIDSPESDAALRRCLADRDWQVRQAAEDLLGVTTGDD